MTIHKEGYRILTVFFVIICGLIAIVNLVFSFNNYIDYGIYVVLFVLFILVLQFFRSPKRNIILDENNIICPADGKVVTIEKVFENEYFKDERIQISVFMSPLNVHINRYPIGGEVAYYKYHPGLYLVAWHPKSSTDNERSTVVVENDSKKTILMRQIAGAVARRIVTYSKENQKVKQGEEMGFIKFGSRVDLFLPVDTKINVKIGQKVKGGSSVIGMFE